MAPLAPEIPTVTLLAISSSVPPSEQILMFSLAGTGLTGYTPLSKLQASGRRLRRSSEDHIMERPGEKLKRARERLKLTYRDVEDASQQIARRRSRDEFVIAL